MKHLRHAWIRKTNILLVIFAPVSQTEFIHWRIHSGLHTFNSVPMCNRSPIKMLNEQMKVIQAGSGRDYNFLILKCCLSCLLKSRWLLHLLKFSLWYLQFYKIQGQNTNIVQTIRKKNMQNLNYYMIKQCQTQSRHSGIYYRKGSLLAIVHCCIKKLEHKFYQIHLPKKSSFYFIWKHYYIDTEHTVSWLT